jgi:hypothetical protein
MASLTGCLRSAGGGTGAAGTCGIPGAAMRREAATGAQATCGTPRAALRREMGA